MALFLDLRFQNISFHSRIINWKPKTVLNDQDFLFAPLCDQLKERVFGLLNLPASDVPKLYILRIRELFTLFIPL